MKNKLSVLSQKTRCFSAAAAFQVLMTFISPALWIFTSPQSILARVSQLACSSTALGACWVIAGSCVLPFIVMQITNPHYKHRRIITKISNAGTLFGGLTWFFIAFISRNLDYDFIILNFLINGIGAFVLAALLANGLNDDQIELTEIKQKEVP